VGKPSDTPRDESPVRTRWRTGFRRGQKKRVVAGALALAGVLAVAVWAVVGINYLRNRPPDPRLIGAWQSDADATIEQLRKVRPVTEAVERDARKKFGRMRVTYTAATFTMEKGAEVDVVPYQVVRKDADSVVIRTRPAADMPDIEFRVRFVGPDVYWVDMAEFGISECFRRVKSAPPRRGD
jgi:hypothetical protein